MSVSVTLICNGCKPGCEKRFEADPGFGFATAAVTRREAAKAGWAHVPNRCGSRRFDRDYCPACKPEGGTS